MISQVCIFFTVCISVSIGQGPELDESLFFPGTIPGDNTTIFINWGLHADSIPASCFVITVGLLSEGVDGRTFIQVPVPDPTNSPTRHQFSPVTPGEVYGIAIWAVGGDSITSPEMSLVWRVGEDILPSFTNFSASSVTSAGFVAASWALGTPGLRPLAHVSVQWVEESAVQPGDDLSDPSSSVYPLGNIAITEYDTSNLSQVLTRGQVITHTLWNVVEGETYFVGVTGTNVSGSKTTVFLFTAEAAEITPEQVPLGNSATTSSTTLKPITTALLLSVVLHTLIHNRSGFI